MAQNYDALLAQGIYGPRGKRFEKNLEGFVSGGNAQFIKAFGRALRAGAENARRDPEKRLRASLNKALSSEGSKESETVILSGEAIPGSFDIEGFEYLKKVLEEYFDEISIIHYVRHLTDHAVSQYGEYVRRRRMKDEFSTFAKVYQAPFMGATSKMESVFGKDQVRVLLFESERENLWFNFVRYIGGTPEGMRQPTEVNRSLCLEEIALLRDLNRLGIRRTLLAKTVSRYCAAIAPVSDNRVVPSAADIEIIGQTHAEQMEFINARLKDGTRLRPASESLIARSAGADKVVPAEMPFTHMRQMLISAMAVHEEELPDEDEDD